MQDGYLDITQGSETKGMINFDEELWEGNEVMINGFTGV